MHRRPPGRAPRWFGAALTLLSTVMIAAACAGSGVDRAGEGGLALTAVLPERVPGGTRLVIAREQGRPTLNVRADLYDLRFESVGGSAFASGEKG